jgi:hypothetical protein
MRGDASGLMGVQYQKQKAMDAARLNLCRSASIAMRSKAMNKPSLNKLMKRAANKVDFITAKISTTTGTKLEQRPSPNLQIYSFSSEIYAAIDPFGASPDFPVV